MLYSNLALSLDRDVSCGRLNINFDIRIVNASNNYNNSLLENRHNVELDSCIIEEDEYITPQVITRQYL